jgi:hypothetical protein
MFWLWWLWIALTAGVMITSHITMARGDKWPSPRIVGSHCRQSDLRRTVGVALLVSRYPPAA